MSKREPNKTPQIWVISRDEMFALRLPSNCMLTTNPDLAATPRKSPPDLVTVDGDYGTPEENTLLLNRIQKALPNTPILVVTGRRDRASIFALLKGGAKGIIHEKSPERIHAAIGDLLDGGLVLGPEIAPLVVEAADLTCQQSAPQYDLNEDEIDLLKCVSLGLTKKEIADQFGRSVHTIDNHFRRLYNKLDVNHLGGAIGKAFRAGLID